AEEGEAVVTIADGASWTEIVDRLERAGLVERRWYFEFWARRRQLPRRVEAGTYRFEGPMDWSEMAEQLQRGVAAPEVSVTFPEGFNIFEMADRLEERGLVGREAFLAAARDPEAVERAGLPGESFEGYLFPDTYRFRRDVTAAEVVARLHTRWRTVWKKLVESHGESLQNVRDEHGLSRHDVVTLASIVQAEATVDEERALIARVLLNRLDASMKLQADPTCVYGEDLYRRAPSPELCRDPMNRYSTYVVEGLPPGPIGNPGRASLRAVMEPADGRGADEYLYFVARDDGSGEHVFSRSYSEHRRAVERHLK
ncbi:MAG: endolytic transglycosylase MltG, partial [Bradymonadaceae bacterium]